MPQRILRRKHRTLPICRVMRTLAVPIRASLRRMPRSPTTPRKFLIGAARIPRALSPRQSPPRWAQAVRLSRPPDRRLQPSRPPAASAPQTIALAAASLATHPSKPSVPPEPTVTSPTAAMLSRPAYVSKTISARLYHRRRAGLRPNLLSRLAARAELDHPAALCRRNPFHFLMKICRNVELDNLRHKSPPRPTDSIRLLDRNTLARAELRSRLHPAKLQPF